MTSRNRSENKQLDPPVEQRDFADLQARVLDALTSRIAVVDEDGRIAWVNQAWRSSAEANGRGLERALGENYLEFCERAHSDPRPGAATDIASDTEPNRRGVAAAVRAVLAGHANEDSSEYSVHSAVGLRSFRVTVTALTPGRPGCAVVTHVDVTDGERGLGARNETPRTASLDAASRYYRSLFECAPGCYLVLNADDYTIVAVSDAYLRATMTSRGELEGRNLFEAFPDPRDDPQADGTNRLRESIERAKRSGRTDVMPAQRYPIRRPEALGGGWEERIWSPVNTPVPGPDGRIAHIIHRVEDVTEYLRAGQTGAEPLAPKVLESRAEQVEADVVLRSHELRRANEKLEQSAALLGMALRVSRSGAWWADLDPLRLRWSAQVREFFELPADYEPEFESELKRLVPEHRAAFRAAFEGCVSEGRSFDLEFEARTTTGRRCWIRAIAEAVRDGAGRIVRVQGALQDISPRKQAEQNLAASERRFRQLAEALPMIVWSATPSGEVDYSNQRFFEYTGASPDAAPATRWQPSLHPDDHDECVRAWKRSVEEGTPYEIEYRLRRACDGEYRWFRVQATPVHDAEGRVVKWFGTGVDVHETKQLEREARTLAKRLTTTLESITDAFCTLDAAWRFQYVNSEAERLLRRSRAELAGVEVWSAFPDLRGSRLERELRRAASEHVTVGLEHHAESVGMWFEVRAYPSDGGLTVYFRDATERVRIEHALRTSEERFRLLSRATNDAIWDWDLVTGTLWWNDGFERQFGFERAKLPPTIDSWTERIHPDERESMLASVQQAIDSGAPSWTAEYRFRRSDGEYVVVFDRGYVIRDESGKPVRMIGGMNDLSDRRRAEETLRQQAALLDQAPDAILVRSLDQTITYWNRGAERIYGWSAEEVLGRTALEVLYRDPAPCVAATEATLKRGEWTGELQHLTKRGQALSVECRWTLLRDAAGNPRSILAINTDVTRKKQLEAQFIRAQRMESIGTLAGGIAHDLNNVLAPIMISIELLQQAAEDDDARELLKTIETSTRRGADLVRQVLSFARGVEGKRTQIALEHLLWEIQAIAQDTFPKNIAVSLDVERGLHVVSGDPTQLHQVLLNLLVNARDALPHGGSIRIHAQNIAVDETYAAMSPDWRAGAFVAVTVADDGVGIAADNLQRIFEPFFTTKEVGKGTGLGLSTSLAIVRSHGGFIDVRSELGHGATFRVFLPRSDEDERAESADATAVTRPRGSGELVLVVDDEASIRNVVQATLQSFGYRVVLASNGAEAISIYAQRADEIALVLTDLAMPIMDGAALIAALRTLRPGVRVVASSGQSSNRQLTKNLGDSVRYFVPKPYTADALLRTIRDALDSPAP